MLTFFLLSGIRVGRVKKEIPTLVFSCRYCKIFKNSFFIGVLPHVHYYTFPKFYVIIEFSSDVFGYKISIFHISCANALFSFITLVLESQAHGYFIFVFIIKFLVSVTFGCITTSAPALY